MDTLDKPAEPTRPEPNAKINKPSKIHNKTNRWIQAKLPAVSYIPAVVLLAVGLVVLALVLLKVAGAARRLVVTRGHVNAEVGRSTGFLKARMAALRIAVRDRRRPRTIEKSTEA